MVKHLEQRRRRLMNCHQHRLSGVCQLSQEPDDVVRRLSVLMMVSRIREPAILHCTYKTRSWLVQENQSRWLGYKLDTNRKSFPLLHGESGCWSADNGVFDVSHFEEIDDRINVSNLFVLRH